MTTPYEINQLKFIEKLEKLRVIPEQVNLQKMAASAATKSKLVTLLLLITFSSMILSYYLKVDWIFVIGTGAVSIYFYILSQKLTFQSLIIAKEQDRKYMMSCFREANSIDEMNLAGWFQYFPEMIVDKGFDQIKSDETAVKEINRMRNIFAQTSSFEMRLKENEELNLCNEQVN